MDGKSGPGITLRPPRAGARITPSLLQKLHPAGARSSAFRWAGYQFQNAAVLAAELLQSVTVSGGYANTQDERSTAAPVPRDPSRK